MPVYPSWASVASQAGRLLKLRGSAKATRARRRIREQYGERKTVSRGREMRKSSSFELIDVDYLSIGF